MKISRIQAWKKNLRLKEPYWLSGGRLKFEQLDSTIVCIETDNGYSGWGEACPWGHTYLPAHGAGVRAALSILAPAILGRDVRALDDINRLMDEALPGHLYAKSPLDIACWDIIGQASGMPLWALLGSEKASAVQINSSISTDCADNMVATILKERAAGYRVHSAKIGSADVNLEIKRINSIDAALVEGEKVTYDINRAWTPSTAIQVLNASKTNSWIEQPCETIEQCLHVRHHVEQALLLDECLSSFQDHLNAWKWGVCEGIKLKPNRVGGLTKARRIRDFALSVGWPMHIEDVGGSVLADTVAIHLAASTPSEYRLASWLCHAHLANDLFPGQGARQHDGMVFPPNVPGIGITVDLQQWERATIVYEN